MPNQTIVGTQKVNGGTLSYGERDPATGTRYEQFTADPVTPPISTPNASSPKPTTGDIYKGLVPDSDPTQENAYTDYGNILKEQTAPVNEADIQAKTMARFQSEIDALNQVYAEKKQEEMIAGKGRLGSDAAIQARRGLIGSDFGSSQTAKVSDYNQSIQNSIDAEKASKISAILTQARKDASDEVAAKTAARKSGAAEYIAYLNDAASRKTQRVSDTVKNVLANGVEADDNLFKELATMLGVSVDVIKAQYNTEKTAKDQAKATADAENIKNNRVESDGVVYERQSDGSYKAVTPTKTPQKELKEFNNVVYSIDYDAKGNPVLTPVIGNGGGSGGSDPFGFVPSGSSTPQAPVEQVPATFEEYLKQEEDKARQTFSPEKRAALQATYDSLASKASAASTADLSKYSYAVQQAIKGNVSVDSLLTGGSAAERKSYQKQLAQAEQEGLLGGASPEQKLYAGLNTAAASAVKSKVSAFKTEPIVQNFNVINEGYNTVKSIANDSKNPSDHQALIYAFAKIMDPNSVVREGEYATVQKYAQSLAQAYGKSITQAINGTGILSPTAIENMKKTLATKYQSSLQNYKNVYTQYAKNIDDTTGKKDGTKYLTDYSSAFPSTPTGQSSSVSTGQTSSGIKYQVVQ